MVRNEVVLEAGMTGLITGASSGIGEQFARQLATRGINLVLVARNLSRLESLAAELRDTHGGLSVTVISADLSVAGGVAEVADRLASAGLTVDVLINKAGVGSHDRFVDQDPGSVMREIGLNCTSLVALTKHFLSGMVTRNRGGIINVASTAGFQPVPTMAVYAASKAFVLSFTEAIWSETSHTGVRVLALCPGPTDTAFFENASAGEQFLTEGRQTPARVAEAALRAFDTRRSPSLIPGLRNRLLANGYRILPRTVMIRLAERTVRVG